MNVFGVYAGTPCKPHFPNNTCAISPDTATFPSMCRIDRLLRSLQVHGTLTYDPCLQKKAVSGALVIAGLRRMPVGLNATRDTGFLS